MRKVFCGVLIVLCMTGCVASDMTSSVFNKTGTVISDVMSGGKIHITLGFETDAAYNNEVKPEE